MVDGKLFRAFRFAEKLFNLPEGSLGDEVLITILPGDNIFMLDASWIQYDQFFPYFEKIRQHGGKIITMVYDLIPVRFPETCHQVVLDVFEKWLNAAIYQSDELIGISKTVIDDVVQYIGERKISLTRTLDLAYIHLGADISTTSQDGTIRDELRRMSDDSTSPLFLMIGTIEPRKGHAYTLDAFEQLWKDGKNYRLCIVGKVGWNVEQTELRIRNHHELGKKLIFFENINDAELNICYSTATALIAASIAEGFGLPIIEAALHNVPVIASDIPVFREVGGEGARYFSRTSSSDIMKLIQDMAEKTSDERAAFAKKVKYLSWKESAAWLIGVLENNQDNKDTYHVEGV